MGIKPDYLEKLELRHFVPDKVRILIFTTTLHKGYFLFITVKTFQTRRNMAIIFILKIKTILCTIYLINNNSVCAFVWVFECKKVPWLQLVHDLPIISLTPTFSCVQRSCMALSLLLVINLFSDNPQIYNKHTNMFSLCYTISSKKYLTFLR